MSPFDEVTWPIEPGVGVGPLRLGMGRAEIRSLMAEEPRVFERAAGKPIDAFTTAGAQVQYEDDVCVGIELGGPGVTPVLNGQRLLDRPFRSCLEVLQRLDPEVVAEPAGLTSTALGIALYAPSAMKEPQKPVEGVLLFHPKPQTADDARTPLPPTAIVLTPEPSFLRIDEAMRDLGLRKRPTTALLTPADEPETAEWSRRGVVVTYSFDPTASFRVLRSNVDSTHEVWAELTSGLPHLSDNDVIDLLFSNDAEELLRGLFAARALRLDALTPRIEQLRRHRTPDVAYLADVVARELGNG